MDPAKRRSGSGGIGGGGGGSGGGGPPASVVQVQPSAAAATEDAALLTTPQLAPHDEPLHPLWQPADLGSSRQDNCLESQLLVEEQMVAAVAVAEERAAEPGTAEEVVGLVTAVDKDADAASHPLHSGIAGSVVDASHTPPPPPQQHHHHVHDHGDVEEKQTWLRRAIVWCFPFIEVVSVVQDDARHQHQQHQQQHHLGVDSDFTDLEAQGTRGLAGSKTDAALVLERASSIASRCSTCSDDSDIERKKQDDGPFMRWFEKVRPWVLTPNTWRRWLFFLAFWGTIIAPCVYLFIWGFPKLVDYVIVPVINTMERNLTRVEIGVLVVIASTLLPIVLLTKLPPIWLAALVFNFPEAFVQIEIAAVLSIIITYWIGKRWLQRRARRFLRRYKRTRAVLSAVKDAGPAKVVFLLHLGPLPTPLTHYLVTFSKEITFWPALIASTLGSLPSNVMAVLFGDNIKGLAAIFNGEEVNKTQLTYTIVSLTAAAIVLIGGTIYARRALRQIEEKQLAKEAEQRAQREAAAAGDCSDAPPAQLQLLDVKLGEPGADDKGSDGSFGSLIRMRSAASQLQGMHVTPFNTLCDDRGGSGKGCVLPRRAKSSDFPTDAARLKPVATKSVLAPLGGSDIPGRCASPASIETTQAMTSMGHKPAHLRSISDADGLAAEQTVVAR
mmetsp:Transcript_37518/g.110895  ORF Transcript_37518/g.110895 Transcript_37518/m.110895 type:complete len:669 (-) Transcript_37518:661-2667(-)